MSEEGRESGRLKSSEILKEGKEGESKQTSELVNERERRREES